MYCILQTLYDIETKDVVLYLGVRHHKLLIKDVNGEVYEVDNERVKPIQDNNGKIHVGKEVDKEGTAMCFFGYWREEYWDDVKPDTSLRKFLRNEHKVN